MSPFLGHRKPRVKHFLKHLLHHVLGVPLDVGHSEAVGEGLGEAVVRAGAGIQLDEVQVKVLVQNEVCDVKVEAALLEVRLQPVHARPQELRQARDHLRKDIPLKGQLPFKVLLQLLETHHRLLLVGPGLNLYVHICEVSAEICVRGVVLSRRDSDVAVRVDVELRLRGHKEVRSQVELLPVEQEGSLNVLLHEVDRPLVVVAGVAKEVRHFAVVVEHLDSHALPAKGWLHYPQVSLHGPGHPFAPNAVLLKPLLDEWKHQRQLLLIPHDERLWHPFGHAMLLGEAQDVHCE
mmetsp:Transcript_6664/g.17190  ORF Transcript_6664/g.17190 Transcript_6664/m.17190 type:complete len:292 (-) Transcript_6664:382-1257(-)